MSEKGYYSIIQYCPDLWRGEAANVGVVLFQPESRQMNVQLSDTLARVRHFFKPDERQIAFIADAARAVRVRLTTRAADFKGPGPGAVCGSDGK